MRLAGSPAWSASQPASQPAGTAIERPEHAAAKVIGRIQSIRVGRRKLNGVGGLARGHTGGQLPAHTAIRRAIQAAAVIAGNPDLAGVAGAIAHGGDKAGFRTELLPAKPRPEQRKRGQEQQLVVVRVVAAAAGAGHGNQQGEAYGGRLCMMKT